MSQGLRVWVLKMSLTRLGHRFPIPAGVAVSIIALAPAINHRLGQTLRWMKLWPAIGYWLTREASLVFDEARLAPEQTIAQELDFAPALGEMSQHIEHCQQRTVAQRAAAANYLLRYMQRID